MLTTTTEEPGEPGPSGFCPETKQVSCRKLTCWQQGVPSESKTAEGQQTSRGQEWARHKKTTSRGSVPFIAATFVEAYLRKKKGGADGLILKKLQHHHFFMETKKHTSYYKKSVFCQLFAISTLKRSVAAVNIQPAFSECILSWTTRDTLCHPMMLFAPWYLMKGALKKNYLQHWERPSRRYLGTLGRSVYG